MTTAFGTIKKLGPGHYRVIHRPPKKQHHSGTPCGYCGKGRRSDARGLLCSSCRLYAKPRAWEKEQG
jgi:hypothetical protein